MAKRSSDIAPDAPDAQSFRFRPTDLWQELRDAVGQEIIESSGSRRLGVFGLLALFLWFGAHAGHEALWSWRYWKVDPFSVSAPVQWPVVGAHAQALEADSRRIDECLAPDSRVFVAAPEAWTDQRFYLFMWLTYTLPGQKVLDPAKDPLTDDDVLVAFVGDGAFSPQPPSHFHALQECSGEHLRLFTASNPHPITGEPST